MTISHYLGLAPHPENAVQAKACLESGGWWSDDPPACHDVPNGGGTKDSPAQSSFPWPLALAVGALALAASFYLANSAKGR